MLGGFFSPPVRSTCDDHWPPSPYHACRTGALREPARCLSCTTGPWGKKLTLMNSRKFLLAVGLIALVVTTLTAVLLFDQRDRSENGVDATLRLEPDISEDSIFASSDNPATQRELPRGRARIEFVVQDASGRPQPGVRLKLNSLKPEGGANRIVTGARGEAIFRDLAAGPYGYLAEAPDGAERISDSLFLEAGERKHLTLRQAGSDLSITGRVRNQRGRAVAGIVVSIEPHRFASAVSEAGTRNQSRQNARSDTTGEFAFGDLQEGEYEVVTNATGQYLSARMVVQSTVGGRSLAEWMFQRRSD